MLAPCLAKILMLLPVSATQAAGTPASDVRQIVVFDFLPGSTAEAVAIFEREALPLYRENAPMLRFRGYREVESPVSLDLVVVSSFEGMAGMDASNRALREAAEKRGTSVSAVYGRIAALSQGHTDSFVEMMPGLSWGRKDEGPLVVLESLRVVPGASGRFERYAVEKLVPWERDAAATSGGETGRYLVSDGFDFLRIHSVDRLGDWHRYLDERDDSPLQGELDALVAVRRVVVLAPIEELSVR